MTTTAKLQSELGGRETAPLPLGPEWVEKGHAQDFVQAPIPDELKWLDQWVCWRYEKRNGKQTKVPVCPKTGKWGKVNDPVKWSSFDLAVEAVPRFNLAGIGFVFTEADDFIGIDLDDCLTDSGSLKEWAIPIMEQLQSYSEVSPSGRGIKIFARGNVDGVGRRWVLGDGAVEVYRTGRFFTVTGDRWGESPVECVDLSAQVGDIVRWLSSVPKVAEQSSGIQGKIPEGSRHKALLREAGRLARKGVGGEALTGALLEFNRNHCSPPKPDDEVRKLAADCCARYDESVRATPKRVNAADLLLMDIPEPVWVISDLLPVGCYLLVGRPKVGKSYLALQLSLAVAGGSEALGPYRANRGRVAYFDLEGSLRLMQKRLQELGAGEAEAGGLEILDKLGQIRSGGSEQLDALLVAAASEGRPYTMVVIDTFLAVAAESGRSDILRSEYKEVAALTGVSRRHNVCILMVHHSRKQEAENPVDVVAGTTGVTAGVDGFMVLRSDGPSRHRLHVKNRESAPLDLAVQLSIEDGRGWTLLGEADDVRRSEGRAEILEALQENGPLTPVELQNILERKGATIRSLLRRMVKDGEVEKRNDGRYALIESRATDATAQRAMQSAA